MNNYRYLGLDLDNTIHDFGAASSAAMQPVYEYLEDEYGVSSEQAKAAYKEILHEAEEVGFEEDKPGREYRTQRFVTLLKRFSVLPCDHDIEHLLKTYAETLDKNLSLNPGASELMSYARARNIGVAIITDGPEDAQEHTLEALGIRKDVDAVFVASSYGVSKRAGLLKKALEALGCEPDDMLYVGDSVEKDIVPAVSLGIKALLYDPDSASFIDAPEDRQEQVVTDLVSVEKYLEK